MTVAALTVADMPVLVLASRSASRQAMLHAAGVDFVACPAAIDERALEATLAGAAPATIALALAEAKALAVPAAPGALVLGSDSLVVCGGRRFDKPASRAEAAEHLRWFSGKEILLHSAAVLVRDEAAAWRHGDMARLRVRTLGEGFIADYLGAEWPAVSQCVGVFRIEGPGVQLFESIQGNHFTILGMPLLPVLGALRSHGILSA